jgi:hypothetical protein
MRSTCVRAIAAILSVSLMACSSMRAVPDWRAQANSSSSEGQRTLKVGDEVTVTTADKGPISLVLTRIEPDALVGTTAGSEIRLPFEQVSGVEVRRFDGLRTTGLTVLIILALLYWALSSATFMTGP